MNQKEQFCEILFMAVLITFIIGCFLWATSAENWYANNHDSECEGEHCHCYERLITNE